MRFASLLSCLLVVVAFAYPTSSAAGICDIFRWSKKETAEQKTERLEKEQLILSQILNREPRTPQEAAVLALWRERGFEDVYNSGRKLKEIEWMVRRDAPLGFNPDLWERFKTQFHEALSADKIDDAQILIDGSSTTFYTLKIGGKPKGYHFEASPGFILPFFPTDEAIYSDYNLKVYSARIHQRLTGVRNVNLYTPEGIFVNDAVIREHFPVLASFVAFWSKLLKKKVRVRFYENWPSSREDDFFNGWPLEKI